MTLNLLNAVAECLAKRAEQKFTAREIADWMFQAFPAECEPKKSASIFIKNDADLVQQLVSEIDARRSTFKKGIRKLKPLRGVCANTIGRKSPIRLKLLKPSGLPRTGHD